MASVTTNYGFDVPTSSDLVKNGATQIALLGQDLDTFLFRPFSKNVVINSSNTIWQRGTSFSLAASNNAYTADRWQVTTSNAAATVTRQVTGDTTNLPFIQYCTRIQRNSAQTGTTGQFMYQTIESVNSIPFAGKSVTMSFYVRAGATYISSGASSVFKLWSGTGTDQNLFSGFTGQASVATATPTITATWQRVTVTGTVAATATQLAIGLDMGAVGTAGATDYLEMTGWQLEVGSQATPFTPAGNGSAQAELAMCQRYYVRWSGTDNANSFAGLGNGYSGTQAGIMLRTPVQMRVNPTAVDYNGGKLADGAGGEYAITAITINQSDSKAPLLFCTVASGLTQYRLYYTYSGNSTSAYIGLTAEL
jgi:hypothetical protein